MAGVVGEPMIQRLEPPFCGLPLFVRQRRTQDHASAMQINGRRFVKKKETHGCGSEGFRV